MKKKILFLCFALVFCLGSRVMAADTSLKLAVIDSSKILREYKKAQDLLKNLKQSEMKLNQLMMQKKQEIELAKQQNKTETEIQMMAEKIRMEIEPQAKKIEQESQAKSDEIEKIVNEVIKNYATKLKFDLVVVKEAVLHGGVDITNEIIKELNK